MKQVDDQLDLMLMQANVQSFDMVSTSEEGKMQSDTKSEILENPQAPE